MVVQFPPASEIIDFWFADALQSLDKLRARMAFWFTTSSRIDDEIRQKFGHLPDRLLNTTVMNGENDHDSEMALAKVLVLDQFPRNIYRGQARAFAYDATGLLLAKSAIHNGALEKMHPVHSRFLVMPYEHSESIQDQEEGVKLCQYLHQMAPADLQQQFEHFIKYAKIHRDIIREFGRFPHRNSVLGRNNTRSETLYLKQGGERFGQ